MQDQVLIPHLFRKEYSKITAVLTQWFGMAHIELAEDIASETFLWAMETWPYKGIPENPTAWLYTVAKNKAKNHLKRTQLFSENISPRIHPENALHDELDWTDQRIADSQLQMLFALCHPAISEEAQISLSLRILCGLGIGEIADAFLTGKETIHKRLQRAKERLRAANIQMELPPPAEILPRLSTVLRTLYLLFREGYYSESHPSIIRQDLCFEAMNLTYLLLGNPSTQTHETYSLMALMCFHASRIAARQSEKGDLILYKDQNETLWDNGLIEQGFHYLQLASKWEITSKYYLEASIAYWHTVKTDNVEKWESILKLYDLLLVTEHSPIIALNRIVALSKVKGNVAAIEEAEKHPLPNNHFYHILLSDLYQGIDPTKSISALKTALKVCKTEAERRFIQEKLQILNG